MILHQIDKVFIIPVVQSSFSYLQFCFYFLTRFYEQQTWK